MYEIDMMEGALRSRGNRIMQLEGQLEMQQAAWRDLSSEMGAVIKQRDILREALEKVMSAGRGSSGRIILDPSQEEAAAAALRECE